MKHPVVIRKGLIRKTPIIVPKELGYVHVPKIGKNKISAVTHRPQLPASFAESVILPKIGPTLDQNGYPACVGFTGTSSQMRDEKMEHGVYYFSNADALDLYMNCKAIDGYPGDGTYGAALVQVMSTTGVRTTGKWILTIPNVMGSAIWRPFDTPRYYKIKAFQALINNVDELCSFIDSHRRQVMVGMYVDDQLYDPPASNMLPPPNGRVIGGHEMEIYGYDRDFQGQGLHFAIKNSWSKYWAKGGKVWMPASWLNQYSPDFYSTSDERPDK